MAFDQQDTHQPPQATVSLSETSLQNPLMIPSTPESIYVKEEEDNQVDQKPTRKRKSWGQELPTPKTNLPPRYALPQYHDVRKRAKTEDEKEQRRIERVLRNRAAAQSSRERKRQEVEKLEGEKATIEQRNQYLEYRLRAAEREKSKLARQVADMSAQMEALKRGTSVLASTSTVVSAPLDSQIFDSENIKQEVDDYPFALPTPQTFNSPSTITYSPSQSPAQPSLICDDDSLTTSPDLTQHPAEMFAVGSTYDPLHTSTECDPIIFGKTPHLDCFDFGSLFAVDDAITHDLQFPKDGVTASPIINHSEFPLGGNDFPFDSMVDFDGADESLSNKHDLVQRDSDGSHPTRNDSANSSESPAQIIATSSTQQPFFGAST
ncbi:MAG: hypothetical protein Q9163_002415 [Psora crenata]